MCAVNIYADLNRTMTHEEVARHTIAFVHWPIGWNRISVPTRKSWKEVKATNANLKKPPANPGLYMWVLKPVTSDSDVGEYVMYIGEAIDLRARMKDYLTKEKHGEGTRPWFERAWERWDGFLHFRYLEKPGATKLQLLEEEQKLIQGLMPPLNKKIHGHLASAVGAF